MNTRLLATALFCCSMGCATVTRAPVSPNAVEVTFFAEATSRDDRRLIVTVAGESPLAGEVDLLWPGGVVSTARLVRGAATFKLPAAAGLIADPLPEVVPALADAIVQLRGKTQQGQTTVVFGGDPAVVSLRSGVVEAYALALKEHRTAWVAEHRADVDAWVTEAHTLYTASVPLEAKAPRGRSGVERDALQSMSATCLSVRPALEQLQRKLARAEEALRGEVPGMPKQLTGVVEVKRLRRDLRWSCERVTRAVEAGVKRDAVAESAVAERTRLKKSRRAKRALASVALVDEILRSAATDDLFHRYEDALLDWGDAETLVLRLRKAEPRESELAIARAAEARKDVDAVNAMITLTLSGRSGQLSDAVFAAAKRLKPLKEADREAVLGLFSPELTPASRVLQQLVRDRL